MISNWFLYGQPDNYIIEKLYFGLQKYWKIHTKVDNYFCFHYIFNDLYRDDSHFSSVWDRVPKLSADIPHFVQFQNILAPLTPRVQEHIMGKKAPLYKLTYKYNQAMDIKGTNLEYLLNVI